MKKLSLKFLFSSINLFLFLLAGIGASLLMHGILREVFEGFTSKNLEKIALSTLREINKLMISGHGTEIGELMRQIEKEVGNLRIMIEKEKKVKEGVFFDSKEFTLRLIHKINFTQECVKCHTSGQTPYYLHISLYEPSFRKHSRKLNIIIFTITLTMVIVTFLITYLTFNKFTDRELNILLRTLEEINAGILSSRVNPEERSTLEFTLLAKALNRTLSKLESYIKEREDEFARQIQRADRLATVGEIASAIAHEIKNPLAGISGAIQVIRDSETIQQEHKKIFNEILNQISRVSKTIHDLLSLAREVKPSFDRTHPHEILDRITTLLSKQIEKGNVKIIKKFHPDVPYIMADSEQLQQVFLNLLLNAIQAMPEGGTITVETEPLFLDKEKVKIKISDTGIGMDEEIMERIFEPFFTTKPKGTGLGLYTTRKIVEIHGGKIHVESTKGKGSTFTIILPVYH